MLGIYGVIATSLVAEEKAYREYLLAIPEGERESARERRRKAIDRRRLEIEREEYLDAIRPKTIWFYLGLSSK